MARKETVSFILFGGTGDLTKRKLVPAFAEMVHNGVISKRSTLIGISRKDLSDDDYKKFLLEGAKGDTKRHVSQLNIKYYKGDFSKDSGLKGLPRVLKTCETKGCNRVYYLATSFKFFGEIVSKLKNLGLHQSVGGFTRVVFEKPFGDDLKSSDRLDKDVKKVFEEKDIYRIDHYLGKETVQNLDVLRFTNPLVESSWCNDYISQIDIIADEEVGVGNRLDYYNDTGAVKDMVQNHLLQVLSYVLMERPKSMKAKAIHDMKVKALESIKMKPAKHHLLGKYIGYRKELKDKGLDDKRTETFALLELESNMPRWKGTRIYLRTGKKLRKKHGQVRLNFRMPKMGFKHGLDGVKPNQIIINIDPVQDVNIFMNSADPYKEKTVHKVNFEFTRKSHFGGNSPDAYAVLLAEVVKGEKILFPRSDGIRESWRIVEDLLKIKGKIRFMEYSKGFDPDE